MIDTVNDLAKRWAQPKKGNLFGNNSNRFLDIPELCNANNLCDTNAYDILHVLYFDHDFIWNMIWLWHWERTKS